MPKFVDCNEWTWQVSLWLEGEQHFFSARTAADVLKDETELWKREGFTFREKAAKLRLDRQVGV